MKHNNENNNENTNTIARWVSPEDQEILEKMSSNLAVICGEIPPMFRGTGEFRARVNDDGRACADGLFFVTPDGTGAGLWFGRAERPEKHCSLIDSCYCHTTEDGTGIRIIVPAKDVWSMPRFIFARVASEERKRLILSCYE